MNNPSNHHAEQAVFGRAIEWNKESTLGTLRFGVEESFPPIGIHTLEKLVNDGHLDPDQAHNYAPTVSTFLSWGQTLKREFGITPLYTGFMIAPYRSDSRISINGLILQSESSLPQPAIDRTLNRFSPDLIEAEESQLRLWWD